MNKARRKLIAETVSKLQAAHSVLENVRDAESDAMDNIPENLQESDRYSSMEDAVDVIDEAIDGLDEIISSLTSIS